METLTANPMTFEQAMAILDKRHADTLAKLEVEKQLHQEEMIRRDIEFREYMKKRDAEMKILTENFGNATNRLGEIVEFMVAPNLLQKFDEFGFCFRTLLNRVMLSSDKGRLLTEVDILLLDGDKAMVVEVKTKPKKTDLERHLKRMKWIEENTIPLFKDIKEIYSAVAGAVFADDVMKEAIDKGFYVISQKEANIDIFEPTNKFITEYNLQ